MTEDITFHVDDTWVIDCTVVNTAKEPVTIRSAEWRMASASARLVKVTTEDGGIVVTGPGTCTVTVGLGLQVGILPGTYDHELWVVDDANGHGGIAVTGKIYLVNSLKRRFP